MVNTSLKSKCPTVIYGPMWAMLLKIQRRNIGRTLLLRAGHVTEMDISPEHDPEIALYPPIEGVSVRPWIDEEEKEGEGEGGGGEERK